MRTLLSLVVVLGACGSSAPPATTPPAEGSGTVPPAMAGTRPEPFTEPYPSMEDCLKVWKLKRAEYDKLWGGSGADNGAAYWKSDKENVELACNPVEKPDGSYSAEMLLRYSPLEE